MLYRRIIPTKVLRKDKPSGGKSRIINGVMRLTM
jgi:hypothetical protein